MNIILITLFTYLLSFSLSAATISPPAHVIARLDISYIEHVRDLTDSNLAAFFDARGSACDISFVVLFDCH